MFGHAVLERAVVGRLVGAGLKAHRAVAAVHVPSSCSNEREGVRRGGVEGGEEGRGEEVRYRGIISWC